MSGYSFPSVVALCYWLLVGLYGAKVFAVISPISAVGSKFFHDNGQQYYVKGKSSTCFLLRFTRVPLRLVLDTTSG
jgi:hypothetical protein